MGNMLSYGSSVYSYGFIKIKKNCVFVLSILSFVAVVVVVVVFICF